MSDEHANHHVNYLMIFVALCVATALSVVADVFRPDNKIVLAVIVLAIATAKALFVLLFFMHLKFEGRWKYVLLAPTMILAMGIPLALLPDIGVHYYTVDVPQLDAYAAEQAHPAAHDEPDEETAPAPGHAEPH